MFPVVPPDTQIQLLPVVRRILEKQRRELIGEGLVQEILHHTRDLNCLRILERDHLTHCVLRGAKLELMHERFIHQHTVSVLAGGILLEPRTRNERQAIVVDDVVVDAV